MTTLIKELIDIPEEVRGGDFVLKLTDGVTQPEQTLAPYVVTKQLAKCFDESLSLVKGSVDGNSSKAAYLHGSFGSGKSHFMAVLHLLLQQQTEARSKEGLEGVVSKHNDWLEGKNFLLVPYHMIGKASMEEAVLGGYVSQILKLRPDAPIPGVYKSEAIFKNARQLRNTMGDEPFFRVLNEGASSAGDGGGWGDLESNWDASTFEEALVAPPADPKRTSLIGALVETVLPAFMDAAQGTGEAFVPLDEGLSIISQHAKDLGYDALVLFLDELILWLATKAATPEFIAEEGPKVSKLVEYQTQRPIPIVSFVARQRDLKELVGDGLTGAEQLGFADVLQWWEARFETITLEDRNLPEIAARRVLRPKSEAARQQIEQSWLETEKIREGVLDILQTESADRDSFRKVYPFSPALIETLIAVSSVLQRERTALKVMVQLLVDQRDTLELGQIVPVGDLYGVIAQSAQPFTEGMRIHFESAKALYQQKLRPMLENTHGLAPGEVETLPANDAKARGFFADDRLVKTLLLSALVPEVGSLKALNSERLSALNHGSVKSPIPGRERQTVLNKVRDWASQVGEIKIGEENDPVMNIQLTGVDTESILENAKGADNTGNRRRKVRELLFEQLGIQETGEMFITHEHLWNGARRSFQVVFGNVRELPDESLAARSDSRKLVLDFPFDDPGHSPLEDLKRLDDFRAKEKSSRTLVWLPSFLSQQAQNDLGTLVKLDEVLKSDDSLRQHANHLSDFDRSQARISLDNRRSQLRNKVIRHLEGAYGADSADPGAVDETHSLAEHFQSLDPSFTPRPPAGMSLKDAFEQLLGQLLAGQFPGSPEFGDELKLGSLKRVQEQVGRACLSPDGRIDIDRNIRDLMRSVSGPLEIGEMGETHFVIGRHWYNHFQRQVGGDQVTVGKLREAIDLPSAMGLTRATQDLLIMLYADQSNRSFFLHGGAFQPDLDKLSDEMELREQALPEADIWEEACRRAAKIFGLAISPLLNATNLTKMLQEIEQEVIPQLEDCQAVHDRIESLSADYEVTADASSRLKTSGAVLGLVRGLAIADDASRISILASADLMTSADAMGTSFKKAASVVSAISGANFEIIDGALGLSDERAAAAQGIRDQLCDALTHDEYAVALSEKLRKIEGDATRLLSNKKEPAPSGEKIIETRAKAGLGVEEVREVLGALEKKLAENGELRIDLEWKVKQVPSQDGKAD